MINFLKNKIIIKIIGMIILAEGSALLPCLLIALINKENTALPLSVMAVCYLVVGISITFFFKITRQRMKHGEGFLISTISWITAIILGTLPFFLSTDSGFTQCLFESTAGFTTTAAHALDLNILPSSLILWRALISWLGGIGILVLVISFLPSLGISGANIASAETTGPYIDRFEENFFSLGKFLYTTYLIFTGAEFLLLLIGGVPAFDALVNTLTSVSTGGLLITEANRAFFASTFVKVVIAFFSLLLSINFVFYYYLKSGRKKTYTGNTETSAFLIIIASACMLISLDLFGSGTYTNLLSAFKDSILQVISFASTSGFYVTDYTEWPTFSVVILFILMLIGGCSLSTAGSLKVIRFIVFLKLIARGLFKQIHPRSVKAIKIKGKAVSAERASEITAHIILYFFVLFFSFLIIGLNNMDMETTITSSIALFSNTGPALGVPGANASYSSFSDLSLVYMSFLMMLGRLEMTSILVLFTRSYRKINRPEQF